MKKIILKPGDICYCSQCRYEKCIVEILQEDFSNHRCDVKLLFINYIRKDLVVTKFQRIGTTPCNVLSTSLKKLSTEELLKL